MRKRLKNDKNWYKNIKLIILDWDGVIGALGKYFLSHLETAALQCDFSLDPIRPLMNDMRNGVETRALRLRDSIRLFWPAITKEEVNVFLDALEAVERKDPYPVIEGSKEAILRLQKEGIMVALCTANHTRTLQWRLDSTGVNPKWFKVISNPDSAGVGKPHPFALQYILNTVGVPTKQALFVGDWAPDLEAAKAAGGVPFIGVTSGSWGNGAFLKAGVSKERIFDDLSSFVVFFLQQRKKRKT